MVGSSASVSAVVPSIFSVGLSAAGLSTAGLSSTGLSITGFSGGGILSSTCFGGGGSTGSTRGNGGGSGAGLGSAATEPGGLVPEPKPGVNEKSSANEDEIQGTCSLRDARVTPTRVRFSVSSAIRSGTRISLSSSCTNRLWSPPLSEMTEESAAEYITSVPFGAITGARPAEKLRNLRSNGLRLEASIRAILTPAPRLLISPSTVSRLKPSRRTSDSVQIWASTGIM